MVDHTCIVGPQHAAADPSSPTGYLAVKHSIIHHGAKGYRRRSHGRSMLRPYKWTLSRKNSP
ncbi:MAG: hypothetical protein QNJ45_03575 [Ardenticatenaceae bacterium]|nr:hypothetical protein [Ardenticatenaceae bacterium]